MLKKFYQEFNGILATKEFLLVLSSSFISFIIPIYLSRIILINFSIETLGIISLFYSLSALFFNLFFSPISQSIKRFYNFYLSSNILKKFNFYSIFETLLAVTLVYFILNTLYSILGDSNSFFKKTLHLSNYVFLFIVFTGIQALFRGFFNTIRKRNLIFINLLIEFLFTLFLMEITNHFDLNIFFLNLVIVKAIIIIIQFFEYCFIQNSIINEFPKSQDHNLKKKNSFILTYILIGFVNWAYYGSQKWSLEVFVNTESLGQFHLLNQIFYTPVSQLGLLLTTLITPIIYQNFDKGKTIDEIKNYLNNIIKIYSVFSFLIIIFFMFFGKYILSLVFNYESSYLNFLLFFSISALLLQISSIISIYFNLLVKSKLLIAHSILANSSAIFINIFFTYNFGIKGLLFGMLLSSFVHLSLNLFLKYKHIK